MRKLWLQQHRAGGVVTTLKTLFWDVESAPMLSHIWQAKTEYVPHGQILHDAFLLCWGAKWADGDKVISASLTSQEAKDQDDSRIVLALADTIRKADVVVAHNGDRFDLPMLNSRLLALRQEPMGPVKTIDTLKLAKANFRVASNRLDYLGEFLGLGRKLPTDFPLWRRCYLGDTRALKEMRVYNEQDVLLLEQIFTAMKPYVKNLPRMYDADRESMRACPTCGSEDLISRGTYRTQASTFGRLQCKNCGRYCRYRTVERLKKLSVHPL